MPGSMPGYKPSTHQSLQQAQGAGMYPGAMSMQQQQQRQAQALRQNSGSSQAILGNQTGIMQQHPYAVHPQVDSLAQKP